MNNDLYYFLLKELNCHRRDLQFDPVLLDKLDNNYRKIIESKLYELCLLGVVSAFKYIPFINTIDIDELFSTENLDRYNDIVKYDLCKYGYLTKGNNNLLNILYKYALSDINAYKVLIDLYLACNKEEIFEFLNENVNQDKIGLLESRIYNRRK